MEDLSWKASRRDSRGSQTASDRLRKVGMTPQPPVPPPSLNMQSPSPTKATTGSSGGGLLARKGHSSVGPVRNNRSLFCPFHHFLNLVNTKKDILLWRPIERFSSNRELCLYASPFLHNSKKDAQLSYVEPMLKVSQHGFGLGFQ